MARCVPPIADWNVYAAGTSCPSEIRGKFVHSFDVQAPSGKYAINPVCDSRGYARIHGYALTFQNIRGLAQRTGLHQAVVSKNGSTGSDFDLNRPKFRSAAEAAVAARAHCENVGAGLAGTRQRARVRRG